MMTILPLIILVSWTYSFYEVEEYIFCRTEHLGTENLGASDRTNYLWFPNSVSLCFLPYHTMSENANKKQMTIMAMLDESKRGSTGTLIFFI